MLDEVESNGVDYAHNLPLSEKKVSLRRNTGDDELTWEQLDNNFEVLRAKLNEVLQLLNGSALVDSSTRLGKETQTIAFEDIPIKTINSEPFSLNATASSGLPVTITSMNESVATVSGNVVTIVGGGEVALEASQEGDDDYYPALIAREVLTVKPAGNVITFAEPTENLKFWMEKEVLNATASSGLPITYTSSNESVAVIDGNELKFITAGEVTVTANQVGNSSYDPAEPVSRTFTIEIVANDSVFDDYIVISQGNGGLSNLGDDSIVASGNALSPSGKLFYDSFLGSGLPSTFILYLDEAKTEGFQLTVMGTPLNKVRFLKDDNTNYEIDLGEIAQGEGVVMTQVPSVPLAKEDQTISWDVESGSIPTDSVIEFDATASSGLEVTYEYDNSLLTETANALILDQVGTTIEIKVKQSGNGVYNPAELVVTLSVEDIAQSTITLKKVDADGNLLAISEIIANEGSSVDLSNLAGTPHTDGGAITHRFSQWQSTTDPVYSIFGSPTNPSLTVIAPSTDVEYVVLFDPVVTNNVKVQTQIIPDELNDTSFSDEFNFEVDLGNKEYGIPSSITAPDYYGYTFVGWSIVQANSEFSWEGVDTDRTRTINVGFEDVILKAKYEPIYNDRVVGYFNDYDGEHFFTYDVTFDINNFTGTSYDGEVDRRYSDPQVVKATATLGGDTSSWTKTYVTGSIGQVTYTATEQVEVSGKTLIKGTWTGTSRTGTFALYIPFDHDE